MFLTMENFIFTKMYFRDKDEYLDKQICPFCRVYLYKIRRIGALPTTLISQSDNKERCKCCYDEMSEYYKGDYQKWWMLTLEMLKPSLFDRVTGKRYINYEDYGKEMNNIPLTSSIITSLLSQFKSGCFNKNTIKQQKL